MEYTYQNIDNFISEERKFLDPIKTKIDWEDNDWDCSNWLFHRGSNHSLSFSELGHGKKRNTPLPYPYNDFCKAIIVHIQRTKQVNFIAIQKYLVECKRLYLVMKERNEVRVDSVTRWHFERTVELLQESKYKMLYDACASLKVISEVLDKNRLTSSFIQFNPGIKPSSSRNTYKPLSELDSDDIRKDDEKLPSYEAMQAYAQCTNNPVNQDEEVLLRTIDLLIAMGQRGNEITLIPFDCWVERDKKSRSGEIVTDARGNAIRDIGIRYFAEKKFQDRVHWLAEQDVKFAKRAVDRIKTLTKDVRTTAQWQEENPGRIWKFESSTILLDDELLTILCFANHYNLHLFLSRNGIVPVKTEIDRGRINLKGNLRYKKRNYYKAGDVESLIIKKFFKGHDQLKKETDQGLQSVLSTSKVLSIVYQGAFQLKERGDFKIKLITRRVTIKDINTALGATENTESIFDRRKLTEADGSRIIMTSHQPRHWRNTLYELAGMSNVQQALAMGRQRLDQNATYQHTSLLERTNSHRDYLAFRTPKEKINFLYDGIREQKIIGEISQVYHELKLNKGTEAAEIFLKTHATAIHVTPFGGCTHDFSQAPCPKHLQCWNGCSHLHRTNTPGESERIQEQIDLGTTVLKSMKADSDGEYGADIWVQDLETKIDNMRKALDIKPVENPIRVFPKGKQMTTAFEDQKSSSVS